jgi:hypothetical protein
MPEYRVNLQMQDGDYEMRIHADNADYFRRNVTTFLRQLGTATAVANNIESQLANQFVQMHRREVTIQVTALPPVNGTIAPLGNDLVLIRNVIVQLFGTQYWGDITVESINQTLGEIRSQHAQEIATATTQRQQLANRHRDQLADVTRQRDSAQATVRKGQRDLLEGVQQRDDLTRQLNELNSQ